MFLIPPACPTPPAQRLVVELHDRPHGTVADVVDRRRGLILKTFTGRTAHLRAVVWALVHGP